MAEQTLGKWVEWIARCHCARRTSFVPPDEAVGRLRATAATIILTRPISGSCLEMREAASSTHP
jgi:hypothetical protein